jgi:uncharacterized protein (TIGR03435 family)
MFLQARFAEVRPLIFGLLTACGMCFCGPSSSAQSTRVENRFEVASVKLNTSGDVNSSSDMAGPQIRMTNVSLKIRIMMAYDVRGYSLSGPDWLQDVKLDIVATRSSTEVKIGPLMQALLVERFKLATHREPKEVQGYGLLVAARGPKIQPVDKGRTTVAAKQGSFSGRSVPISQIAKSLEGILQRPVLDGTNLHGVFDVTLTWVPDELAQNDASRGTGPSIFTALQEQLGLRLESRKVHIDALVVDSVEKVPTEN